MADAMSRSIYSAADETVAQLDNLNRASFERALSLRRQLDAAVLRLGESSVPWVGEAAEAAGGPVTETSRGRAQPDPDETPYVPLPQRTTHGGPFGPVVERKLIAEALAKGNLW